MKFRIFESVSAIVVASIFSTGSIACSFDTDCQPGSQCLKASGSIYGACVGGMSPGNRNDQQPVRAPLDVNATYGNTCTFDTECGPGSVCAKAGGINGTCMRGR